jgi:hypothetical protein
MKFAKYLQHLRYQESLDAQSAPDFDLALNTNPLQRRQFLGALVAGAGSLALAGLPAVARSATLSSKPHFYGICGHYDYGSSKAQLVSDLQSIGATMFRVDTGGFDPTHLHMAGRFTEMTAIDPRIKIFCCINTGFLGTDENSAYNIAFTNGQALAQTLGPMGITDFECGNEMTASTRVFRHPGAPGNLMSDYIAGNDWNRMRGTMRGLIDGVKSVNPAFRCGINFTIAQIAASDMLWNGVSPDGSTGHPTVRWDITTWHNYQVYGDLFNISLDGYTKKLNVIDYISKAYGKPIMITEWQGTQPTDAQKAAHCTQFMTEYYNARDQYNIESIMMYQLGGPAEFGLFANPQEKAAFAAFTSSHPA